MLSHHPWIPQNSKMPTRAIENGPWLWQSNSFYTGYSGFFQFCDAIQVRFVLCINFLALANLKQNVVAGAAVTPDANGVGLEKALTGYANWVNTTLIPGYCQNYGWEGERDLGCMNTYDANNTLFTDMTVGNPIDRQWNWMLCNEPFAYWQEYVPLSLTPKSETDK
jgi:hypothetical protein